MRLSNRDPRFKALLQRQSVSVSEASQEEQARWLHLADIALHNHPEDHQELKHRDTALSDRRKVIRMVKKLVQKLKAAA
jgi:hypothetical protein